MFNVLVPTDPLSVPTRPFKRGLFRAPRRNVNPAAGISGAVNPDKVAVFAHLDGQAIRCLSGHLWVTLENDPVDHVLKQGQRLLVPTGGKVIIGGRGRYYI